MGTISTSQPIIDQAGLFETQYNWVAAAEWYEKALKAIPGDDFFRSSDFSERAGYAFYRAALQAEKREDFDHRIRAAIEAYEKASGFYTERASRPRELRSRAMVSFLKLWLTPDPSERRLQVRDAWALANEGLQKLYESGDFPEYCRTYNRIARIPEFAWYYESDAKILEKTLREAVAHGDRIFEHDSLVKDDSEVARSLVKTASFLQQTRVYVENPEAQQGQDRRAKKYWSRAKELDRDSASLELSFLSYEFVGVEGSDEALENWSQALELGRKTRDRLVVGGMLCMLAYNKEWKSNGTEDLDEKFRLREEGLRTAEEGKRQFDPLPLHCPITAVLWAESPYAEYYHLRGTWEPDLEKRREFFERALRESPGMLKSAEEAGYPQVLLHSHHVVSKVLTAAAKVERDPQKKEELLKDALEHRNRSIELSAQLEPFSYLNKGVYEHYLAEIASALSDLSKDPGAKESHLRMAVQHKRMGIEFQRKELPALEQLHALPQISWMAERTYEYGNLLLRLHSLTTDGGPARQAVEAFHQASELFEKANLPSRRAECYWRAARLEDELGERLKAQELFLKASEDFKTAADKLPQLGELYRDYSVYMTAWSEIEKARNYHSRQEYISARDCYVKTASLHGSTGRWSSLGSYYLAWAKAEEAEDFSHRERHADAREAFEEAAGLFAKSQETIRTPEAGRDDRFGKESVAGLVESALIWGEYCNASAALEEAKLLDRSGDHHSSAEKFGKVAESLDKLIPSLVSETDKREIKRCMTLAKAWQLMMGAEAEASPGLYLEAAGLFEAAKDLSQTEKGRLLALGHSRFCRALESGARFSDSRDASLHEPTMHNLESASNYYMKAGFRNASKYAEACKLLFDAYVCVDNANRERDQDKKARLYMIAEKVLEASAAHYAAAEYPAKKDEVLQLLEKIRNERELAVSLTDVLHAPSSGSFGESKITTPTKTQESPVGLEMFDNAHVRASLLMRNRNPRVGESCEVEIELVNAGKGPAQLVKLEELLPEGFELTGKPEAYRLEDSYLNMRGKRLDPLKTEEVKLTLKPKAQGQFTLKPRILYLDEGGKYKSHEPEPISITVKELGITGWIKGR